MYMEQIFGGLKEDIRTSLNAVMKIPLTAISLISSYILFCLFLMTFHSIPQLGQNKCGTSYVNLGCGKFLNNQCISVFLDS